MFYDAIGKLLGRASETLATPELLHADDVRSQRRLRQITVLLRRIGAIWPDLFAALAEECAILEATRSEAAAALRAHGLTISAEVSEASDLLERYAQLQTQLDALLIALYENIDEPWARDTLRSIRHGLAAAAEVQGRLVDGMLAA